MIWPSGKGFSLVCSVLILALVPSLRAADPIAELGKFTVFEKLDLSKLAGGKVMMARGPAMSFPRDLALQAVYLVPAPLAKAVEMHRLWEPSKFPELKVLLHGEISAKPLPSDFAKLASTPNYGAVRALVSATQKLPAKGPLLLSNAEVQEFPKINAGGAAQGALPPAVGAFWSQILLQRAQQFAARGLGGQPAYEFGSESAKVSDELARLLKAQPKVRTQFRGLTDLMLSGSAPATTYWDLFDVDGQGAFSLGATFLKEGPEGTQIADVQFFASSGYFVLVTLYQLWPITVDERPATLVWRGDSISSLALSELQGVERMGSGAAMMKEIQKGISFFLKESGK
jgi:hypothetical protein